MNDVPAPPERRRNAPVLTPKHRISGKVRTAIDAMVWQALKRADAAKVAGMQDNSLYVAMRKPDVRAYYLNELEVLRTSERAQNIHRLVKIRDAANNMPAVNAIKVLEQMAEDTPSGRGGGLTVVPGVLVIVSDSPVMRPLQATDAKPLIQHEPLTDE